MPFPLCGYYTLSIKQYFVDTRLQFVFLQNFCIYHAVLKNYVGNDIFLFLFVVLYF